MAGAQVGFGVEAEKSWISGNSFCTYPYLSSRVDQGISALF